VHVFACVKEQHPSRQMSETNLTGHTSHTTQDTRQIRCAHLAACDHVQETSGGLGNFRGLPILVHRLDDLLMCFKWMINHHPACFGIVRPCGEEVDTA